MTFNSPSVWLQQLELNLLSDVLFGG